ncbi:MAG TPA: hydrogenobyrinic acid a,c-diamide synthase (glutamine-hydrolyzing) [Candidatus Syntrophoarchaeum butanivorans]|uniref:Cobyrinate a,c-diamide synthase n=1 Tax=Candidatus Syntropharchaeum butanivorans TaxID=1839936 RepID=A0A7C0WZM6_9EURY|nr:hydrogenobyrinic acid a,c-diamide synthase (glutamine-hydrolyzing) [Candidatus Syntrophoarchaeum butanivorans]
MKLPRILFAGSGSGVGKTVITTGIMAALKARGLAVQGYKVGPDYIDPGYHREATSNPSRNLDSYLMKPQTIREIFLRNSIGKDISIIEGVRGLFEGVSIQDEVGSTSHIAKILEAPVILIVNARSITKSAAAIVEGFRSFDRDVRIKGVILNNIAGEGHKRKAVSAVENFCGIEVLGAIPRDERMKMRDRHLGLIPMVESRIRLDGVRSVIEESVELDRIVRIAEDAPPVEVDDPVIFLRQKEVDDTVFRVGVAYDDAFNFYYEDSLDLLRINRCEPIFFSPLNDQEPPELDGLYLGGGYPEVFAERLASNERMLKAIKKLLDDGIPTIAECGGLIYLGERLCGSKGVGFLPIESKMGRRYVKLTEAETIRESVILGRGERVRGHEFHYTVIENPPADLRFAYRMLRGDGIDGEHDGILQERVLASYMHLHFASKPEMVLRFRKEMRRFRRR